MNKVEENKKKKFESLLNTSFELFTTKGVSKTSISDIVEKAGVAKGTFYLYFKDKLDIRDRLILHKSGQLFTAAYSALEQTDITDFSEKLIFMANHLLDALNADKPLLMLVNKDLSWGVFKKSLSGEYLEGDVRFSDIYRDMVRESGMEFKDPEIMLFLIVELVGAAGYSAIIYGEPVDLDGLKPYISEAIRSIIRTHTLE